MLVPLHTLSVLFSRWHVTISTRPVQDGIKTTILLATASAEAVGPSGSCFARDDSARVLLSSQAASGSYWHNARPEKDADVLTRCTSCCALVMQAAESLTICCCSGPTAGIVTEVAFKQSEADNCFAESCKMIGIAGENDRHMRLLTPTSQP